MLTKGLRLYLTGNIHEFSFRETSSKSGDGSQLPVPKTPEIYESMAIPILPDPNKKINKKR